MEAKTIKQANDICTVIGRSVELKRKGKVYLGLCPFHDDHQPSLTVNPAKQNFICYACGAKGDVFTFVQLKDGCTFREAVQKLTPLHLQPTVQAVPTTPKEPYYRQLQALFEKHRTGCNPQVTAAGVKFGLFVAPAALPRPFGKYSSRLMFPIHDENGELAGYAGRSTGESTTGPKYLNTPGLPRNRLLYGMYEAKQQIRQTGEIWLVEGFKDVIAMHHAGFTNTVGLMGTAMAEAQAEQICRYARQAYVLMDADEAGRKAARVIEEALAGKGLTVTVVSLPDGEDPDSLYTKSGEEGLLQYLMQEVSSCEFQEQVLVWALAAHPAEPVRFCGDYFPFGQVVHTVLHREELMFDEPAHREILMHAASGYINALLPDPLLELAARYSVNGLHVWSVVWQGKIVESEEPPAVIRRKTLEFILYMYTVAALQKRIRIKKQLLHIQTGLTRRITLGHLDALQNRFQNISLALGTAPAV
ncbi:MAG: CHC2 zinc finger domain-containing protein [Tannerellaceae bacterium]|nr:CHC2 zinc finger domain-containing protein [Tannerellaceae bacterium]